MLSSLHAVPTQMGARASPSLHMGAYGREGSWNPKPQAMRSMHGLLLLPGRLLHPLQAFKQATGFDFVNDQLLPADLTLSTHAPNSAGTQLNVLRSLFRPRIVPIICTMCESRARDVCTPTCTVSDPLARTCLCC